MLEKVKRELVKLVADHVQAVYGVEHTPVVEVPPRRDLGDLAVTSALNLARVLKKNPRQIANELVENLVLPDWASEVRIEGAGYLNFFLHRSRFAHKVLTSPLLSQGEADRPKVIVEHTNINPNKAAHIGHLRNAVLGDVVVRVLRASGYPVEIQNYIDDTGVQLADVVVGFVDLRGMTHAEIEASLNRSTTTAGTSMPRSAPGTKRTRRGVSCVARPFMRWSTTTASALRSAERSVAGSSTVT